LSLGEGGAEEETAGADARANARVAPLLRRAERSAREAAAEAQEVLGLVPPAAVLHHAAGQQLAAGGTRSKLRALAEYWRSKWSSRLAATVLRRAQRR